MNHFLRSTRPTLLLLRVISLWILNPFASLFLFACTQDFGRIFPVLIVISRLRGKRYLVTCRVMNKPAVPSGNNAEGAGDIEHGCINKAVEVMPISPASMSSSSSKKIPNSESRREKAILMKAKEENWKAEAEQGKSDIEDPTEVKIDAFAAKGQTPKKPVGSSVQKVAFPQALEKFKARMKMGNVRRSSAVGDEIRRGARIPPMQAANVGEGESQGIEIGEAVAIPVAAGEVADRAIAGADNGEVLRRHSTGSASGVNRANMMAMIRRLQRRRFRPPTQSTAVKYLQYFMAALFYMGMSPLQPASAKKLPKWLLWVQYMCYWIFTVTSILHSIMDVKTTWVDFQAEENMLNFVTFGFYLADAFTRIYGAKVFLTSQSSTANLLQSIDRVNSHGTTKTGGWAKATAIFMATFALLLTLCSTVFADAPLDKWTFKRAVQLRAYEMAEFLSIWSTRDYANATDKLIDEYIGTYTETVKIYGGVMDVINCAMERTKKDNRSGICPLSIHWRHYKQLQEVSEETNKIFGTLIKLIHLQNLLLFGYFLLEVLKKRAATAVFIIELITVIKVSITYYMVQKSAEMNEEYRQCVIQCSGCRLTIEMDGVEMSVSVLLKDMKKRPIGVGRGEFFVDQAFVLKLVTAVGSIFLLLSDESGEKCVCGN